MIKFFSRIFSEIARGENIDAYFTILIALVLSFANLLGFAKGELIPGITLAVLALLAIASLVSRHRVEDLSSKLSPSINSIFLQEFPASELREDIESANELWLFGASLDGVAKEYFSVFEQKIRKRCKIRVLVTNPDNMSVLGLSEMRAYKNPSTKRAQAQINATLSDFCKIKDAAPSRLQIKTIEFPMPCRFVVVNPKLPNGKIYIEQYPFKTPGRSLPKFVIRAKDMTWFDFYKVEVENFWKAGKEWHCPKEEVELKAVTSSHIP